MTTTRKIEITTNHPDADLIARVAAEVIADELDRRGITWSVTVTDAIGTKLNEWEGEDGS